MIVRQLCVRQNSHPEPLLLDRYDCRVDGGSGSKPSSIAARQIFASPEGSGGSQVPCSGGMEENCEATLGSVVTDTYEPEELIRNPPRPSDVTLELLLASQSHLGHSTSRWNPQNSRYIFGVREGIHIISLDVTAAYLRRAAKVVEEVARRGGLILFVGTRKGQKRCVVRAAELAKGYHVFERWIPGSLTNGQQILGHCEMKVVNALDEELPEFKPNLVDRPVLKPDLVVCFNPIENEVLLHECGLNNVPTIGIIDTDADPTRVTYPIPANDDSLRCVQLIAGVLGRAGEEGQRRRLEEASRGILSYEPITEEEIRNNPAAEQD
ncbi:40S ribosomal protein S2 [Rasamsonia emersonii CBS 393.64]|uniref:40S ribosomal protein S2 n=1 Tax=Rasamsonia emersonii (strain ATCC 16479 / CBS 393.64 / IMI 116815) TaxID=1408163 RepID=A0A0F4Z3U1_RASE3|nr:40S ribosomal protein S2 [Rasamsonia emersonii CBS 393.64]KKA24746.1 40S ribosomal protein S2 [Rasamsonia emersonii CBS 393.64]